MTVWRAFADGLARVARAPSLVAGLWLATILLAWPLALTLRAMLAAHLGDSLAADAAAIGVNHDWWQEFLAQTSPLGQTFVPAVIGVAAVLQNISSIADAQGIPATAIAGVVSAHLVLSLFLTGGVLDRLARNHRVGTFAFFAACGVHFLRLLRLSLIAGVVYSALFLSLHPWLFDTMFSALTRDVTVERTAIGSRFTSASARSSRQSTCSSTTPASAWSWRTGEARSERSTARSDFSRAMRPRQSVSTC